MRLRGIAGVVGLLGCLAGAGLAEEPRAQVLEDDRLLGRAELTGGALAVHGLTLRRDALELNLDEGTVYLARPVQGRAWLGVFLGKGRARLTPATEVERDHLRLLTSDGTLAALEDSFEAAVLVWTDDTARELDTGKAAAAEAPGSAGRRPGQLMKLLRKRLGLELELRVLEDLYGAPGRGLFLARIEGKRYPDLLYLLDPQGAAPGLSGEEEAGLYNADEQEGGWWYLARAASWAAEPARARFEALSYKLDAEIDGKERLKLKSRIRMQAREAGQRLVRLELQGKLELREALLLPERTSLSVIEPESDEAGTVAVLLPEAPAPGRPFELELSCEGTGVLEQLDTDLFYIDDRESWYPNVGAARDSAQYELSFCVPKGLDLISVGRRLSEERRDGRECTAWKSETPIAVAGFNLGKFKKHERHDEETGLDLEIATNPGFTSVKAEGALLDAMNAVRVYTAYFGPLPYSRLALTEQPAGSFGQAWPTLVYLPYTALGGQTRVRGGGLRLDSMTDFPQTVGPHEISHQWWGHAVGWASYRDQWLSEGFAQFSAGLWLERTEGLDRARLFWKDTRKNIVAKTIFGEKPYEAGPLTLGYRLGTRRSRGAGRLIYSKGAYVLYMLRMMLQSPDGEDAEFIGLMKDFTSSLQGRRATLADFREVAARHTTPALDLEGNGRLDWFFRQWVEGSEVPAEYELDVKLEPMAGGQTRLTGSVRQTGVPEDFRMLAPLYVELTDGQRIRVAQVACRGTRPTPFDVVIPAANVQKALLNARLDVLTQEF